MPYKRSYRKAFRRTRPMKRRRTFQKKGTRRIANKALRMATVLNKTKELKHLDEINAGFYPGRNISDHYRQIASGVTQGLQDTERVGDSIYMKTFEIKGSISLPDQMGITLANVTNRQNFIRFWVAVWPNPSVLLTDIQNLFTAYNTTWIAPFGFKEWDERFRARLIYSKLFKINTYSPQVAFDIKIKLNMLTQYDGTGNIRYNNVMYGFISDNTTGVIGGTYAYIHYTTRVTWTDS